MTTFTRSAIAAALCLFVTAPIAGAEVYIRKGDQQIDVQVKGDKLFCTRKSDGFELCNGMAKTGDYEWKGKKMKHPDMPGFMRFNGTVTFGSNGLKIKGCALGMCDAEVWTKS